MLKTTGPIRMRRKDRNDGNLPLHRPIGGIP